MDRPTAIPRPAGALLDWGELTLTHRCNQRCFFCYEEGRDVAREPDFPAVQRLLREQARHAQLVSLCGKEVLLRKDILEIVRYAASLGLKVAVFSNGQALAREGLVEALAGAGVGSVVVSFHFPDAESFACGARVRAALFERSLAGLRNLGAYNRGGPEFPLGVSVETALFALNLGRLADMRRTLLDALGDSPWEHRLSSLLPAQTYDIGLETLPEPLAARRAELAEFVATQPAHVPLTFVKMPLCVLPPGTEQRCLDVRYIHEGTVLTFNHERPDAVTVDTVSTAQARDVLGVMRRHPYRWLCRTCHVAPLCRFERLDWAVPRFQPTRAHRPTPYRDTRAADVLARLGPDRGAVARVEGVAAGLAAAPFPEEAILAGLAAARPDGPQLVEAWAEREPAIAVALRCGDRTVPLLLRVPPAEDRDEPLGALVDYLDVRVLAADVPPAAVRAALGAVARLTLPEIAEWAADPWFDAAVAGQHRDAWRRLGEALWPGLGGLAGWQTTAVRRTRARRLVLELAHPLAGHATVTCDDLPPEERAAAPGERRGGVAIALAAPPDAALGPCRDLLAALGAALTDGPPPAVDLAAAHLRGGRLAGTLHAGRWTWQGDAAAEAEGAADVAPGGELRVAARDRLTGDGGWLFHIARAAADRPHFRRAGALVLWFSHGDLSRPARAFAAALGAVMDRLAAEPLAPAAGPRWHALIAAVLAHNGLADRFEFSVEWVPAE